MIDRNRYPANWEDLSAYVRFTRAGGGVSATGVADADLEASQTGKENEYLAGSTLGVTVYSLPHCPQCKATYRLLDKAGIAYTIIDLTENPEAFQMVQTLGYQAAPVIVTATGDHWARLRPDLIQNLTNTEANR